MQNSAVTLQWHQFYMQACPAYYDCKEGPLVFPF